MAIDINKLSAIQIGLASPEKILEWSYGEVTKPETINYRSQKPELDGLFCERIFGPSKDYECHCGKYKKIRFQGIKCEKCGVEVTTKAVRRERMGHIELASPVAHIWYLRGTPSRIALILDISAKQLEDVVYFVSRIVLDPGTTSLLYKGEVLGEKEARIKFAAVVKEIISRFSEDDAEYIRGTDIINRLENSKEFDFYTYSTFITQHTGAQFGMGAEAIKTLLEQVDLDKILEEIKTELKETQSQKLKRQKLLKRLDVVESFRKSNNRPEWMILTVVPVIPPDLRPMLQLDGGRFATSDLNDLYRRVITRNIRLKRLKEINAPGVILINEKRMLQEAVDALIDNGRRSKPVLGAGGRALKSLSNTLKGKQGRFRQNLLGKRVDYSGRSVIVVGPDLKMYQCGIPREMAVQLFKPFIAAKMIAEGQVTSHKQAERLIDRQDERVWDALDSIIKDHPVLLNRAPTLHRLGIQAFEVKLVDGRAIRLHPLVCPAFNADFDGDQMAVHVPLSKDAVREARELMIGSKNILGPKDGKPIVTPGHDMVLGNYYITLEWTKEDFYRRAAKYREDGDEINAEKYELYGDCEGKVFANPDEAILAYQTGNIHLQTRIAILASFLDKECFTEEQKNQYLITTVGKIIFNSIYPKTLVYLNSPKDGFETIPEKYFVPRGGNVKEIIATSELNPPFKKGDLGKIIDYVFKHYGTEETSIMLDKMKDQGFKYATVSGVTVSIDDIKVAEGKYDIIADGDKQVEQIVKFYNKGLLTDDERHNKVVKVWEKVKSEVEASLAKQLKKENRNPFFMMSDSGARGNASNFTQLAGMRGLMSKPFKPSSKDAHKDLIKKLTQTGGKLTSAEISQLNQMSISTERAIELPIKSSFREGLTVSEFFISTHGARKTMSDTALKTAESGYLTRRLVDVAHDVIVREDDCHTDIGFEVEEIKDTKNDSIVVPFKDRLVGRYPLNNIYHPETKELIVDKDSLITEETADKIIQAGYTKIKIRSLFGCKTHNGVCRKCYGLNLATGREVEVGEAIGTMAAQSIGEPGTQLTMRTFHTGGVTGSSDITQGLPRVQELFETRPPRGEAIISKTAGTVESIEPKEFKDGEKMVVTIKNDLDTEEYVIPFGARIRVKVGDFVKNGQKITEGPINPKQLLEVADSVEVQKYILKEVQKVYRLTGIPIGDKHIEVMIRQMLRKLIVLDGGDTELLPGSKIDMHEFTRINQETLIHHGRPAVAKQIILSITKASLETESFLSAASFQETTRVLTDAAVKGKIDHLTGLKENVIVGKLIPCPETAKKHHDNLVSSEEKDESVEQSIA